MSTSSLCSLKKSAPIIGMQMLAMTKIHRNAHRRPKSTVSERVPNVVMDEPLTALRPKQSCLLFQSAADGGITLTSVPVLIRNRRPEVLSVRNNSEATRCVASSAHY